MAAVALGHLPREMEGAVVEMRREAVDLVARQQRLRQELSRVAVEARQIEDRAAEALARGEEIRARQILAGGICALKAREALQDELTGVSRRVVGLLAAIVREENRLWRSGVQPAAPLLKGGGRC
jgi:phage shock protein A